MEIRRATVDDAAAICDMHIRSIRGLCAADYATEQIEAWAGQKTPDRYRRAMTKHGQTMFIATGDAGRVIGFVSFKDDEIFGLYVAPENVRRGVGSRLLAVAEAEIRSAGVKQIKFRSTFTAIPFYARHGYQRGDATVSTMSGVDVPCVWMSKSL